MPEALVRPLVRYAAENTVDAPPGVQWRVLPTDESRVVKRAIDVVGAVLCLIVLAPLIVLIALAIRATSPGPVFFVQERHGLGGRRFAMYKFRTMVEGAEALQEALEEQNEADGAVFKIRDDPRVTAVGRILRVTSLDELPQLWNVIRGEMSLVGPRPLPPRDVSRFQDPWHMRRFSVPPGMTGLWQVSGRSDVSFDEWMRMDLQYIDGWSLGLDLKILALTLPAVCRGTGAA